MTEYFVPTAQAQAELVEKRSRFIGQIFPITCEEEARACIEAVRKKHYDARHNCWCYRLHDGPERYSDDGEPQGTAGQPMLNVFQREGIENVCCVVTRYFGGVLLGAGGLVRAYTQAAKDGLDRAGISVVRRWMSVSAACSYALFERVKGEVERVGGVVADVEYAADVTVLALLPEEQTGEFSARIVELTAGEILPAVIGEEWRAVPQ